MRAKKNIYSIRVGSESLARRLIEGGPWNVKGLCFTIRHWPLYHSVDDIEPSRATYWIQAHGIPREMLSKANGRKLGLMLGSVLEVEDPAVVGIRGYLRLRIDFDACKPLSTSCLLPCQQTTKKIRLKYENLKNFCFRCGRLGHMISVCNYHVNPLLIKLGVVYDHSLVAEAVQKPAFTLPHHPLEFPYIPAPDNRRYRENFFRQDGSGTTDFQIGPNLGTTPQSLKNSRQSCEPQRHLSSEPDLRITGLCQSSEQLVESDLCLQGNRCEQSSVRVQSVQSVQKDRCELGDNQEFGVLQPRGRLDMWNPETNGTIFRNGSVTLAISGLRIDSPSWADPEVIPPWAFNKREDFIRANPCFPVPGFENDKVLVPLPVSNVQLLEFKPTSVSHLPKPRATRKRKQKNG